MRGGSIKLKRYLLLALLPWLCGPSLLSAHGSGLSFEKEVGEYLVDIGYDSEPRTGVPVRFEFNLLTLAGEPASFDEVWVRILEEKMTSLAGPIRGQELGRTTLLYEFSDEGVYTLDVSYRKNGNELAEAAFDLLVGAGAENPSRSPWMYFGLGAAIGALAFLLILDSQKRLFGRAIIVDDGFKS